MTDSLVNIAHLHNRNGPVQIPSCVFSLHLFMAAVFPVEQINLFIIKNKINRNRHKRSFLPDFCFNSETQHNIIKSAQS